MSNFSVVKKGYNPVQVDEFISKLQKESGTIAKDLRLKNSDLAKQLETARQSLDIYKSQEKAISDAFIEAHKHALQIESAADEAYDAELSNLRFFHARWTEYYRGIIVAYPLNDAVVSLATFMEKMTAVFRDKADINQLKKLFAAPAAMEPEHVRDALAASVPAAQFENEKSRLAKIKQNNDKESKEAIEQLTARFNPLESVKEYYEKQSATEPRNSEKNLGKNARIGLTGEDAFDFEEALNPKEPLEEILKELI